MIKGLTVKVFFFLALFPEDVPISAGLLSVLAPMLTNEKNEKNAKLSLGKWLGTLINFNLLFSGRCVLFFPFPPDPPDVHEAQRKEGTPIRSSPRGRGALGLGGIEVSRDSRSVQPVFRRKCV